jgi:hypothetical protein
MEKKKNIFISMSFPYLPTHSEFLDGLISFLQDHDMTPRVMNRTDFLPGNPLPEISRVLQECDGAIVFAFERLYFPSGVERRRSPSEVELKDITCTTPWNQIEAAMAYQLGIPILVFSERGLRCDGLLEEKYDWYVERVDIRKESLGASDVRARLQEWCRRVKQNSRIKSEGVSISEGTTISDLAKHLTLKTAAQIIFLLSATFSLGLGAGQYLPQYLPGASSSSASSHSKAE